MTILPYERKVKCNEKEEDGFIKTMNILQQYMTLSTLRPAGGQAIGADFQKPISFAGTKIQ